MRALGSNTAARIWHCPTLTSPRTPSAMKRCARSVVSRQSTGPHERRGRGAADGLGCGAGVRGFLSCVCACHAPNLDVVPSQRALFRESRHVTEDQHVTEDRRPRISYLHEPNHTTHELSPMFGL
eukprot:2633672-Prymnesium_polylepis.1